MRWKRGNGGRERYGQGAEGWGVKTGVNDQRSRAFIFSIVTLELLLFLLLLLINWFSDK